MKTPAAKSAQPPSSTASGRKAAAAAAGAPLPLLPLPLLPGAGPATLPSATPMAARRRPALADSTGCVRGVSAS